MSRQREWSDVHMVIGLRVKSVERGRKKGVMGPAPMSAAWYDLHRDRKVHAPSQTIVRRYGTWFKACAAAGVPVRDLPNAGRPQTWTDEEMLAQVAEFFAGRRRNGYSFQAYSEWAKLRKARPSGPAVIKRFGSWNRAKELAGAL